MTAWATIDQARASWPDAPADDVALQSLLDDSTDQLVPFAPAADLTDDAGAPVTPPERFARACILHARALWNAARDDAGSDVIGFEQFAVRIQPVSLRVQRILRPSRGVPGVG